MGGGVYRLALRTGGDRLMSYDLTRSRVAFERREQMDDGAGNMVGDWVEQFQCAANLEPKFGTESVMAGRLTGVSTFVLTVRYSPQSKRVTTDWRARNVRTGVLYNIRAITDAMETHQWLEMLVQSGVAA